AGGGSIYILLLVAGMDLKSTIAKVPCKVAWDLRKMLRDPSCVTTELQKLITSSIIPTIAKLRVIIPFTVTVGNSVVLDCTCLKDSNRIFKCLRSK
ncbi:hypothetical protein BS17DRAFT_850647, partial [Gyrodon lividus]